MSAASFPDLNILIELDIPEKITAAEEVQKAVTQQISIICAQLGIPAHPRVHLNPWDKSPDADPRYLRFIIEGKECIYPQEILRDAWYAASQDDRKEVEDLFAEFPNTSAQMQTTFFTNLVSGILFFQPERLLEENQLRSYLHRLAEEDPFFSSLEAESTRVIRQILQNIIRLGISIADHAALASILQDNLTSGTTATEISEMLISRLAPDRVRVHMEPGYLRSLTTQSSPEDRDSWWHLREWRFSDAGTSLPPLEFVSDDTLKPGWLRVSINHILTLPVRILNLDEIAVNESPWRLEPDLGYLPRQIEHPRDGNLMSALPADQENNLPLDIYRFSPMNFAMFAVSREIQLHGWRLLTLNEVERQVKLFDETYPKLVTVVKEKLNPALLTSILRVLAAEGISLRNYKRIFEAVLDFDYVVVPAPTQSIILDDRLPIDRPPSAEWLAEPLNIAQFIRTRMPNEISAKYTEGWNSLSVFTIAPEVEALLEPRVHGGEPLQPETVQQVLSIIRRKIGADFRQHRYTPIMTSAELRPYLRELLAPEFPHLPVLAFQELRPDVAVSVIEVIRLEE
jgi:hypothetical protein